MNARHLKVALAVDGAISSELTKFPYFLVIFSKLMEPFALLVRVMSKDIYKYLSKNCVFNVFLANILNIVFWRLI